MTGNRVYPRLPNEVARQLLLDVREHSKEGTEAVARLASGQHPKASPVPTGGRPATEPEILDVRSRVLGATGKWVRDGKLVRSQQPEFDAVLGQALHDSLDIVPADAASSGTWNFLTLVVMPDVAVTRFNDLSDERGLGSQRNVLRRAWYRWDVLGAKLLEGQPMLGEDELVGLLERTAVARNRPLVEELANAVLAYRGESGRPDWARELYKRVRRRTGPVMLDLLSRNELAALVRAEVAALG